MKAVLPRRYCFLTKPTTHEDLTSILTRAAHFIGNPARELLIVEDDENQRSSMLEPIGNATATATAVGTAGEALALIRDQRFDCIVVDLLLPEMSGLLMLLRTWLRR